MEEDFKKIVKEQVEKLKQKLYDNKLAIGKLEREQDRIQNEIHALVNLGKRKVDGDDENTDEKEKK